MTDRLQKLRAWVYLRAPAGMWTEVERMGLTEPQILSFSEERLKVVAVSIVFAAARRGREAALAVAAELEDETGYGFNDFDAAKAEIAQYLTEIIRDQAVVPPPEESAPSGDVPGSK